MNERILLPLNENPLPLTVINDLFKICFHDMEKLLSVEEIFEKLKQNGFQ